MSPLAGSSFEARLQQNAAKTITRHTMMVASPWGLRYLVPIGPLLECEYWADEHSVKRGFKSIILVRK